MSGRNPGTPLTGHPSLPDAVPLVAGFHDDRNRLSYYHPRLRELDGVRTPATRFFPVEGDTQSYPDAEYREMTRFMQRLDDVVAFVRGDFSSGKYRGEDGSKLTSQDPVSIEQTVLELLRQLALDKRHLGGRLALREWVEHDTEVRYFIADGEVVYAASLDDTDRDSFPDQQATTVAAEFDTFAWSVDFIRSEVGLWYCIDMGLDGLYWCDGDWVAISEHPTHSFSPQQYADEMPAPEQFRFGL